MKKGITIIVGLAVVCVLGGVYAGIGYGKERSANRAEAALEAKKTYLTDMSNICYLSYEYEGNVLEFEEQSGSWYYVPDHSINLKQSLLEELASKVQKLEILRTLEGGDGLAEYGLEEPAGRITARDIDGREQTVVIGNAAGDDVYACLDGSGEAVVISANLQQATEKNLEELTEEETEEVTAAETEEETAAEADTEVTAE